MLGPLRVTGESGDLLAPGAKERAVLAFLVARVRQVVTSGELVDALWPDDPPRTATRTLQSYVARLRAVLNPAGSAVEGPIRTEGRGYRLVMDLENIDSHRFARLAELGHTALSEGRAAVAAETLAGALALWRGPPYAGFESTRFGRAESLRLMELHRAVREDWFAARLASGDVATVAADLEGYLAENPMREPAWALLVRAHAAAGSQAAALEAIARARHLLAEELGVDPGEELQSLQARVLAQDPTLLIRALPSALRSELLPKGGQLVGRRAELAELLHLWQSAPRDSGFRVLVTGEQGSGRWRLACEVAARVHEAGGTVVLGDEHADDRALRVVDARDATQGLPDARVGDVQLVVCGLDAPWTGDAQVRLGPMSVGEVRAVLAGYAPSDVDRLALDEAAVRIHSGAAGLAVRVQDAAVRWSRDVVADRVAARADRSAEAVDRLESERSGLADDVQRWQELGHVGAADPSVCPWRGLESYSEQDAPWFAGRERLTAELLSRLHGDRTLLLVGASGSGKSSLLRAGVLAALAGGALPGSGSWVRLVMRPGEHPMRQLTSLALAGAASPGPDLVSHLRAGSAVGGVQRIVLVVDQIEECWTVCADAGERDGFLDAISHLAASDDVPVTLVAAVRADHAGSIAAHPGLAGVVAGRTVFVGPMGDRELHRVVAEPAARGGLVLEPGLTDALVDDTRREPGGLPLLSTALADLWEHRDGRCLTVAQYVRSGGVGAAIARMADRALDELDGPGQEAARTLLLRLAGAGEGDAVVRRRVSLRELSGLTDHRVLDSVAPLADARLLTISDGHVEVAHEALFRSWPRLAGWLAEDAAARNIRRRVTPAVAEWVANGHDDSYLWSGVRLASAAELFTARPEQFTSVESDFIVASTARADAERRHALEQAGSARRQNRRLRALLAGLAAVLVVAVVAGGLAVASRDAARARGTTATAQRLAATALTADFLAGRMLTAVEAVRTEESPQTLGALLSVLDGSSAALARIDTRFSVVDFDAAPGGTFGYAVARSEDVISVDLTTGEASVIWTYADSSNTDVRVSPDGSLVAFQATRAGASTIRVIDAQTGRPVWEVPSSTALESGFDFTGADELAVASPQGLVRFRVGSNEPSGVIRWPVIDTLVQSARLVRVDRSRVLLFSGTAGAQARLVDLDTGGVTLLDTVGVSGAISADGRLLVTQPESPGPVRLVDLAQPALPGSAIGYEDRLVTAGFTPGETVVLGGSSGMVVLVDPTSLRVRETFSGHSGEVTGLVTSPDGRTLWSSGRDEQVLAWDLTGDRRLQRVHGLPVPSTQGRVSADGSVAIIWSPSERRTSSRGDLGAPPDASTVVDLARGEVILGPLPGGSREACASAITPDGSKVVVGIDPGPGAMYSSTSSEPSSLIVYEVPRGEVHAEVPLPWVACGVDVTSDGRFAVVNGDGGVGLVDLTSGALVAQRDLPAIFRQQTAVEVSGDGRLVALARGPVVMVLATATLREVASWPTELHDAALSFAWLDGGSTLAQGGEAGTLTFRAIPSGRALGEPSAASPGAIWDLAANSDGTRLASVGGDGALNLWDSATRQVVGEPLASALGAVPVQTWTNERRRGWRAQVLLDRAGWVRFGSDATGEFLEAQYAAGGGASIRYPVDTETLIARACAIAGREPTPAEWESMHGDAPQKPTCGTATQMDLLADRAA